MEKGFDFSSLPVVGRETVLEELQSSLQLAMGGMGRTLLVKGERGTGKTHLCRFLKSEAERRGFTVAFGSAYQAEAGVPHSLYSDAFLPILRAQPPQALTVLTRGGAPDLAHIFPGLVTPPGADHPTEPETHAETRTRVLWTFLELLRGLAARDPLCIILEDLQWADTSSLKTTHFLARHLTDSPVLILLSRDAVGTGEHEDLAELERSLLDQGVAREISLPPFTREETGVLLKKAFGVGEEVAGDFTDHLHRWTQGNPYFLEETLQGLIRSGGLYRKGGAWLGWGIREMELPRTVRDAILARMGLLTKDALSLAELVAVLGGQASFSLLQTLSPLPEADLLGTLDLLVDTEILIEGMGQEGVVHEFRQPLVREAILKEMGLARTQVLHGRVARTLEETTGYRTAEHSALLAYHHLQAGSQSTPSSIQHLARAGRDALNRFGNAEAARYLRAALSRMDLSEKRGDSPVEVDGGRRKILEDLADALSRMGNYAEAIPLWEKSRELAVSEGALEDAAECGRQIGIIKSFIGDPLGAVEEFDTILRSPTEGLSKTLLARTRFRRGVALGELGKEEESRKELEDVVQMAEELQDPVILAQAHRALVLQYLWTAKPDLVRAHADRALHLAKSSGALSVEFWTRWELAVLEGLLGNSHAMSDHLQGADQAAQELRSPVLGLRTAELAIELAAGRGQWDSGIIIGEQAIALARELSQTTILTRVLVWTSLIYLGRGQIDLARPLIQEAWEVSGAGGSQMKNVHSALSAFIGRGYLALREGDVEEAIRIGRAALKIADEVGYGLWAFHHLLPLAAEAYLRKRDLDGAREIAERLRSGYSGVENKAGLAWSQACEALVTWLEGDLETGTRLMGEAAQALEEIPLIGDAARIRRVRAGRLAELGDRVGALEELNRVHEIFLLLGAEPELEKTRAMFRELGARPPRRAPAGEGDLSPRELEIARLVGGRKSNKAIARALSISPRTVSTHLSNIFQKLGISSRGELVDYLRSEGLSEE
jgi:DNA-binding CsgD family transcriptional regulator